MRQLNSPEQFDDGIITSRIIRDAAVAEAKIASGAVTRAKITKGFLVNWLSVPPAAPMTPGTTGVAGDCTYQSGYFYICVATNTWIRELMELTW